MTSHASDFVNAKNHVREKVRDEDLITYNHADSLLQSFYISRMIEATLLAGYQPIEKDQCFQTFIRTDLSADFKEVIYSGFE